MMPAKGLEIRDYETAPLGKNVPVCAVEEIPKSEWKSLIKKHQTEQTRPLDIHLQNQVPLLNQSTLKYCWVYAPVAGVMNRLAYQGIDPVPELSAAAVGSIFKKGRNVGGYVEEGVRACLEGIPSAEFWPNGKIRNAGFDFNSSDAPLNVLASFSELKPYSVAEAMSVLLGENPRPIAFALPWWRHAVLVLAACFRGNEFGFHYANSYGPTWKGNGFGTILGEKAKAHEMIVCENILARKE